MGGGILLARSLASGVDGDVECSDVCRRTEAARAETGKQLDDAKHALAQCRAENQRLRTAVAAGKPGTWGV